MLVSKRAKNLVPFVSGKIMGKLGNISGKEAVTSPKQAGRRWGKSVVTS
jgi:hypothetical protein